MAQTITITAVPLDRHGYNISCFGEKDGAIDITVTGGTPPYKYAWSNGSTNEDVQDLPAGFYAIVVKDAMSVSARAEVILTEPDPLKPYIVPYEYPNGYNISCYNCYNGSLDLVPVGGAAPYTYQWYDGPTTEDRSLLGSDNYGAVVTDANGCIFKTEQVYLRAPDRSDWTMSGNAGTNPTTQYLGTSDNKDVVFKSNGQEQLRLLGAGGLKLSNNSLGTGPLFRDANGILRAGNFFDFDVQGPCAMGFHEQYWKSTGNTFAYPLCPNVDPVYPRIGTLTNYPLLVITNGQERMRFSQTGQVGIGTEPPIGTLGQYRLFVEDGIATRDVLVKMGDWPDYVFTDGYRLLPLKELRAYLHLNKHLPGIPTTEELAANGGVELGDMQRRMVKVTEEQALYILQLEERLEHLEQRLKALELFQH